MAAEVPFTIFKGHIKQLEKQSQLPITSALFDICFANFKKIDAEYARLQEKGTKWIVTAAGSERVFGFRPRRFAGGPGLPPSSYFSVCDGPNFDDRGTLRDEITAYYDHNSGILPVIFDPKAEKFVLDHLREAGLTEDQLEYPLYFIVYRVARECEENSILRKQVPPIQVGGEFPVTYGVVQLEVEIDRIIDLRLPKTQDWFVETFVGLELEAEVRDPNSDRIRFPPKERITSFSEMLQVIVGLEIGGGRIFSQAIGQWLRRRGANGLVFPSARSNAFVRVENERPVEWGGWTIVIYRGAEAPVEENLFGHMSTWRDRDHDHIKINHDVAGRERGSFSIRGPREFNLFKFDLEKQIAAGARELDALGILIGRQNERLSKVVKVLLDQDHADGRLWYSDVNYLGFLKRCEELWLHTLSRDARKGGGGSLDGPGPEQN